MTAVYAVPADRWRITKGQPPRIVAKCPGCGIEGELDHAVDAQGVVTPSLECQNGPCNFHEMVRLDGWPGWIVPLPAG